MKKTDTSISAPAAAAPAPVLDPKTARAVTPSRHHKTARTVGFHQDAKDGTVHLFGATGGFITTVPAADVAGNASDPTPSSDSPAV